MNFVKLIFNPIFLLAVGMHAGLLLIPVAGGSSDDIVPAPDPEGESITVTRIPPQSTTSAKPNAGPGAKPNRPTTTALPRGATARTATASRPTTATTGEANQRQPRSQGSSRPQGQRSASRPSANGSNRSNTAGNSNNQASQSATNTPNTSPGLPDLPGGSLPDDGDNAPSTVPVETVPAKPDLVALREGAQSQDVPNLLQQFLARLHHSVLRTTEPEAEEAKRLWLESLEQQPGLPVSAPEALETSLKLNYPLTTEEAAPRRLRSCLNPLPVKGMVGVVVGANGEMTTEPTLLRSSGYGFLNDIALEKIKDYDDFPEESVQKIYTVDVEVDYDKATCVDLAKLKPN